MAIRPYHTISDRDLGTVYTVLIHFYRGEVARANAWRVRLDTTTNWAIGATAGILSFGYGDPKSSPAILQFGALLVFLFATMEARRYRYYDLWSARIRTLERLFLSRVLILDPVVFEQLRQLQRDLVLPSLNLTWHEALALRLRRVYFWIFSTIFVAWLLKIYLVPVPAQSMNEIVHRTDLGTIPGALLVTLSIGFYFYIVGVTIWGLRHIKVPPGEVPRRGPGYLMQRKY